MNQKVGESGFQGRGEFEDMIIEDAELESELKGEAREAREIPDVKQPTKQERIAHELTHRVGRQIRTH